MFTVLKFVFILCPTLFFVTFQTQKITNRVETATMSSTMIDSIKEHQEYSIDDQVIENHKFNSIFFMISVLLMLLMSFISHVLAVNSIHYIPESGICLLIGIFVGLVIREIPDRPMTTANCSVTMSNTNNSYYDPEILIATIGKGSIPQTYVLVPDSSNSNQKSGILSQKARFKPEIFFYFILPPIMFCAGFKMNIAYFFHNFFTILLLAVFGTFLTFVLFSGTLLLFCKTITLPLKNGSLSTGEIFLFASLIAPTDPVSVLSVFKALNVDSSLYSLVLGESSLNDALSLVLHETIEKKLVLYHRQSSQLTAVFFCKVVLEFIFSFFGSAIIGVGVGAITAFITKISNFQSNQTMETAFFLFLSYSSFLLAESAQFTGVVSVLFCGIFQAHYSQKNLTGPSRNAVNSIFNLWSYMSENFSFAYMGITIAVVDLIWDWRLITYAIISITFARIITIYLVMFLANLKRTKQIPLTFQHVMVLAGMKGAFSFALAAQNISTPSRALVLSTTISIILFTVFIFGSTLYPLIVHFKIPTCETNTIYQFNYDRDESDRYSGDNVGMSKVFQFLRFVDQRILYPFFTINGPPFSAYVPSRIRGFFVSIGKLLGPNIEKTSSDDRILSPTSSHSFEEID